MAPSLFPFSLLSSDSRFGEPFYNGSRIFPLDKNSLYIYIYVYNKKKERRNRKKKRYYCRARIGRWPHGGLIYSAISLCGRKYATGILISNRRRHSRALNRPAPLSIQCSLDMDRCIVQLPLTCLVALPIDNIKRYIENVSSRPREGRL